MSTVSAWNLFPFPTFAYGSFTDGTLFTAHERCRACFERPCTSDSTTGVTAATQCRFGLTYARIDAERLIVGMVVDDPVAFVKLARRLSKRERERSVKSASITTAAMSARHLGIGVVEDFEASLAAAMDRLATDADLRRAMAAELSKGIDGSLAQGHDFLQFVQLVRGHAEALLLANRSNAATDPSEIADEFPHEGAIYFAASLMMEKMNSLKYLESPNLALGGETTFAPHPFVLKYVRIYDWRATEKGVRVRLSGESRGKCRINSPAIGAVVQSLLDNMVKYAPSGSEAFIDFAEEKTTIRITFRSLGPKIQMDEWTRIYLPQFRGKAAKSGTLDGLGVGLAIAKSLSDVLRLDLEASQEESPDTRYPHHFWTSFTFVLSRSDA